jgi:hypothetical protein
LVASLGVSTLFLCAGMIVAWFASRKGTPRDGDIAMAIFASYVIGQSMPIFL